MQLVHLQVLVLRSWIMGTSSCACDSFTGDKQGWDRSSGNISCWAAYKLLHHGLRVLPWQPLCHMQALGSRQPAC